MAKNGFGAIIIDQDEVLIRVLLPMMWISFTLGYFYLHSIWMKDFLHSVLEF